MIKHPLFLLTLLSLLIAGCGGSSSSPLEEKVLSNTSGSLTIKGEAWADNWFAAYLGEELLLDEHEKDG